MSTVAAVSRIPATGSINKFLSTRLGLECLITLLLKIFYRVIHNYNFLPTSLQTILKNTKPDKELGFTGG